MVNVEGQSLEVVHANPRCTSTACLWEVEYIKTDPNWRRIANDERDDNFA